MSDATRVIQIDATAEFSGVVMDIATFKVSHTVGTDKDTTALQAKKSSA